MVALRRIWIQLLFAPISCDTHAGLHLFWTLRLGLRLFFYVFVSGAAQFGHQASLTPTSLGKNHMWTQWPFPRHLKLANESNFHCL